MDTNLSQYGLYKDALARRIIRLCEDGSTASDDLEDFASYLADETFPSLPLSLREATYETRDSVPDVDELALDSTPASFADTLISYGLAEDPEGALELLRKAIADYVSDACAPPPIWSATRAQECELCERRVPLTYHHLVPRSTHAKALKKRWHPESILNSVAWLCRPCHTAVHHAASNEDLAQKYYTLDLLMGREDLQRWARYASKQRFGVRRG
ncbi:hypothetical protein GGF50DRAFT_49706 [Schizophyllum commune]